MRKLILILFPLILQASDGCDQDGKIIAKIAIIESEDNDKLSYMEAVNHGVEELSKTNDYVLVSTNFAWAPKHTKNNAQTNYNGAKIRHIVTPEIGTLPEHIEKSVRDLIDSDKYKVQFRESFKYPGEKASAEEVGRFYERARAGIQVTMMGSNHGSNERIEGVSENFKNLPVPKMDRGMLGGMGHEARKIANALRGMHTVYILGQCKGSNLGHWLVDDQMTATKASAELSSNNACHCFASLGMRDQSTAILNSAFAVEYENRALKNLSTSKDRFSLLFANSQGLADLVLDTSEPTPESTGIYHIGMTSSEQLLLEDVSREYETKLPTTQNTDEPEGLGLIAKLPEDIQRQLLRSEVERLKAIYSMYGAASPGDISAQDVNLMKQEVLDKRKGAFTLISAEKRKEVMTEAQVKVIRRKLLSAKADFAAIEKIMNKIPENKGLGHNLNTFKTRVLWVQRELGEIYEKFSKNMSLNEAKSWEQYNAQIDKSILGFRESQSVLADKLMKDTFQNVGLSEDDFREINKLSRAGLEKANELSVGMLEPVRKRLVAETLLTRTRVENHTLNLLLKSTDEASKKKLEYFKSLRACELIDIRAGGLQALGSVMRRESAAPKTLKHSE